MTCRRIPDLNSLTDAFVKRVLLEYLIEKRSKWVVLGATLRAKRVYLEVYVS